MIFRIIIEDYKVNSFSSFFALFKYRVTNYIYRKERVVILRMLLVFFSFVELFIRIDSQISYKCRIGRRIKLPHKAQGVIISKFANLGDDIIIYHQVTLGVRDNKKEKFYIGDGAIISAGSKVISSNIGSNSRLSANSVVYKDVAENVIIK